jgi:hypothetical protein
VVSACIIVKLVLMVYRVPLVQIIASGSLTLNATVLMGTMMILSLSAKSVILGVTLVQLFQPVVLVL